MFLDSPALCAMRVCGKGVTGHPAKNSASEAAPRVVGLPPALCARRVKEVFACCQKGRSSALCASTLVRALPEAD